MMKRAAACFVICLFLPPCLRCAAADGFYMEYTPKSAKSTTFYIDVYSPAEISAALFEVSFDGGMVEYRSASAEQSTSTVRCRSDRNAVRVAFADSGKVGGRLCRLSFTALNAGVCRFTLRVSETADSALNKVTDYADAALDVTLAAGTSSSSAKNTASSKAAKVSSKGGNTSYASEGEAYDDETLADGRIVSLGRSRALTYVLAGAGMVILVAGLVTAGVLIGRKMTAPKPAGSEPPGDRPDPEGETDDAEDIP